MEKIKVSEELKAKLIKYRDEWLFDSIGALIDDLLTRQLKKEEKIAKSLEDFTDKSL